MNAGDERCQTWQVQVGRESCFDRLSPDLEPAQPFRGAKNIALSVCELRSAAGIRSCRLQGTI